MQILLILNDPPYGSERVYDGLRLAGTLPKVSPDSKVAVFFMADAVLSAKASQKTPDGHYNVERMLRRVLTAGGTVLVCGTCMDALASATLTADKVLVF